MEKTLLHGKFIETAAIQPTETKLKRSKRHRMKRNNISAKARVEATYIFAAWAQAVEKMYRAKYPEKAMPYL